MLGIGALAMAIAYAFTPGGAGGSPEGFPHLVFWSMRYLTPAVAVGLVCVPLLPALRGARRWWSVAAFGALVAAAQLSSGVFAVWGSAPGAVAVGAGGLVVAVAAALATGARRRMPAWRLAALGAVVGVAGLAAGWKAQDIHFRERYSDPASPLVGPWDWARELRDQRIGIVGFYLQQPLYGDDLSNHVQYVGQVGHDGEFRSIGDCVEWRRALAAGRYRYVVTAPFNYPWGASSAEPREARWTEAGGAAHRIGRGTQPVVVLRIDRRPDPDACPADEGGRVGEGPATGPTRPAP
jgi:hypothetical protein